MRFQRNKDLLASNLDEDLVMLSVQTGKYYGVNSVGRRIWELLAVPMSVSQICDQLLKEYEVSRERCEQEVFSFLNELEAQGLLLKPADACCSPTAP
jgi:hypothetical protein